MLMKIAKSSKRADLQNSLPLPLASAEMLYVIVIRRAESDSEADSNRRDLVSFAEVSSPVFLSFGEEIHWKF